MASQKSTDTETTKKAPAAKRQRVPLTGHQRRLAIPQELMDDKENHYHWFNDVQDRINRALAAGYAFVDEKELKNGNVGDPGLHNGNASLDSRVSKRLRDFTVYLMRVPMEYYLEDEKLRRMAADEVDESIFGGGADKVPMSYGLDVKYRNR